MSNTIYYQPTQNLEAYSVPQFQPLNYQYSNYSNTNNENGYTFHIFQDQFCTLESSSYDSSSTLSFLPSDSSKYYQKSQLYLPDSDTNCGSCVIEDVNDLKQKLKELENEMLGPEIDIHETYGTLPDIDSWRQLMVAIPKKDLKQILTACANAVLNNDSLMAQWLMSELRQLVSVSGEPIQRLGAYMLEGLVARLNASGSSIYNSLKCKEPASFELLSYMNVLYEVCPYFKFGYMSANGAIAEAMKNENRVHIIDFQIGQGSQWVSLIQAFASRPGGSPHIRITGIDDVTSAYACGGGLNIIGQRLSQLAKTFKVPFEFHVATMSGYEVKLENLGIRPNEALAVNFAFMLHHMPDESVTTKNHRDGILRMVKGLNPKVVTLVEQECNTNTSAFYPRFLEALDYYTAMFESIDVTLQRDSKERINVEQHCFAREVVNIIACEEAERVERHELFGKWKLRFEMAGFSRFPLSCLVNGTIKKLLRNYCDKHRVEERDGVLYLGWLNRDLVASCAWR